MSYVWATRGRDWGFTFLATAGLPDPLPEFERLMAVLEGEREGCERVAEAVALKFDDPDGRMDRSGRAIPHNFVLFGDLAARVDTVDDGLREVWPLVATEYASVWESSEAPSARF